MKLGGWRDIWPKNRLNLVAGASGAGKTRWLAPQIFAWLNGGEVLGFKTDPLPIAYIACDRTCEDAQDTMSSMGYDPSKLFMYSFMDNEREWNWSNVVEVVPKGTQLTIIEAIGALIPGGKINDYHEVLRFGRRLHWARRQCGSDFIGTTHVPKLKRDEDFKHSRENVLGSAAWPGIAATIVLLEELDTEQREITIMTRDDAKQKLMCEFDDTGHLVEADKAVGKVLMDRWLIDQKPGTELPIETIREVASRYKVSKATTYRWITEAEQNGRLTRKSQGIYQITLTN